MIRTNDLVECFLAKASIICQVIKKGLKNVN